MSFTDLIAMLQYWTERQPDKVLYRFLSDGEEKTEEWTYADLERRARRIAARLQGLGMKGERAVLLYAPGLEYIAGFFGCVYAGVIAVPAYPPDPHRLARTLPRLQAIVSDCEAKLVLTTSDIHALAQFIFQQAKDLEKPMWLATDSLETDGESGWRRPEIGGGDLAFLQYTSGSTGQPKGVMLSHRNLLENMEVVRQGFGVTAPDQGLNWLPPYHDMGLIGGLLGPIYNGIATSWMSPLMFLQKPKRWLQAISRHRTTITGGPNFAYELCLRKIPPEQRAELDLSSWKLAFSGAEPVRRETLERFADYFAPCGFKKEAFYPCYGLAESTLMVTGGYLGTASPVKNFSKSGLLKGEAKESKPSQGPTVSLVGCGTAFPGHRFLIVHPETSAPCASGEIGEIWVQGPSVARGYWRKPQETEDYFQARSAGEAAGFLRTGDLGFLSGEALFVTGRLKDLIIIRGENHYPQDIETTVEKAHLGFRPGSCAAFSVEDGGEERLVVVQEVDHEEPGMVSAIRKAVAESHQLQVYAVVLIAKGGLPKTSSGKIRRHACREEFLGGRLETVAESRINPLEEPDAPEAKAAAPSRIALTLAQIRLWLIEQIAQRLGMEIGQVDPARPLSEMGLDSKDAVNLSGDLEDYLGRSFSPTLVWKYQTIDQLAQYLSSGEEPA